MIEVHEYFYSHIPLSEFLNMLVKDGREIISVVFVHGDEYGIPHYEIITKKSI